MSPITGYLPNNAQICEGKAQSGSRQKTKINGCASQGFNSPRFYPSICNWLVSQCFRAHSPNPAERIASTTRNGSKESVLSKIPFVLTIHAPTGTVNDMPSLAPLLPLPKRYWKCWHCLPCIAWSFLVIPALPKFLQSSSLFDPTTNRAYVNSCIHTLIRQYNRLFRVACASDTPDSSAWTTYKTHRNFCTEQFRRAKKAYLARFHSVCRRMKSWKPPVVEKGRIPGEDFFISERHPGPERSFNSSWPSQRKRTSSVTTLHVQCTNPNPDTARLKPFSSLTTTTRLYFSGGHRKICHSSDTAPFRSFKSTGDAFTRNRLLKKAAPWISESLTHLYNLSLSTSVFRSHWKSANVTAIFKNHGNAADLSNNRPVSLYRLLARCSVHFNVDPSCNICFKQSTISLDSYLTDRPLCNLLIWWINGNEPLIQGRRL